MCKRRLGEHQQYNGCKQISFNQCFVDVEQISLAFFWYLKLFFFLSLPLYLGYTQCQRSGKACVPFKWLVVQVRIYFVCVLKK